MLQRQEHADIAGTGIERADEGDQQQRPEGGKVGEQQPGGDHQQGRGQQHPAVVEAVAPWAPSSQVASGRTQQGGGAQHAHLPCAQAQRQQIGRQQDTDEAIDEGPQGRGRMSSRRASGEAPGGGISGQRLHVQSNPKHPPQLLHGRVGAPGMERVIDHHAVLQHLVVVLEVERQPWEIASRPAASFARWARRSPRRARSGPACAGGVGEVVALDEGVEAALVAVVAVVDAGNVIGRGAGFRRHLEHIAAGHVEELRGFRR
jgi:hypothetical protein